MATETWINDSGTWREAQELWFNDLGTWREAEELWYNDGGTWRKVFEAFSASLSGSFGSSFDVARTAVVTSPSAVTANISSGTLEGTLSGTGTGLRMSINGGSYLLPPRTISNGDTIRVRQTASASYGTTTSCTLNLGGFDSKTFNVTTEDAP